MEMQFQIAQGTHSTETKHVLVPLAPVKTGVHGENAMYQVQLISRVK